MAITQYAIDNFWNRLRVERNIRYVDLAELFPHLKSFSSIGVWFSGQVMPRDEYIRVLCDFFDVDFDEGKREFQKAHDVWKSSKHANLRVTTGTSEIKPILEVTGEGNARMVTTTGEGDASMRSSDIFELVYGKLPYDLFRKFCDLVAGNDKNALELVYGKVTFEEFIIIQKVIGGEK